MEVDYQNNEGKTHRITLDDSIYKEHSPPDIIFLKADGTWKRISGRDAALLILGEAKPDDPEYKGTEQLYRAVRPQLDPEAEKAFNI